MAGPQYPDVPQAPGVPPVMRSIENRDVARVSKLPTNEIVVTATDKRWGIFNLDGSPALEADSGDVYAPFSVMNVDYSFEYRVADFPIEAGGFESYDKVQLPFETRVVMAKGGSFAERRAFIAEVENICHNPDMANVLYNVVTPERAFLNVNITHGRIDRGREEAGLISVELGLREIRQTVETAFSDSKKKKSPSSADVQNDGAVQTTAPSAASASPIVPNFATPTIGPVPALASAVPSFTPLAAIPMQAFPAQALTVQLGGQLAQITAYQKRTGMFLDLSLNDVPIVTGAACLDRVPIIRAGYSPFVGNLAFVDTQGAQDPTFEGLADRFALVWGT